MVIVVHLCRRAFVAKYEIVNGLRQKNVAVNLTAGFFWALPGGRHFGCFMCGKAKHGYTSLHPLQVVKAVRYRSGPTLSPTEENAAFCVPLCAFKCYIGMHSNMYT